MPKLTRLRARYLHYRLLEFARNHWFDLYLLHALHGRTFFDD
jgi:hypothetical protein